MDYGQAKNILARIFKEYKAFKDLEEVIEFANMQEQRKDVLEKEIAELVQRKAGEAATVREIRDDGVKADQKLKDLDKAWKAKEQELGDAYASLEKQLDQAYKAKQEEFFKEAARLDEAMEDAEKKLEKLNGEIAKAEAKLEQAQVAYRQFKDSI